MAESAWGHPDEGPPDSSFCMVLVYLSEWAQLFSPFPALKGYRPISYPQVLWRKAAASQKPAWVFHIFNDIGVPGIG